MTLFHCMSHDTLWVAITVTLDLLVATGYGVITLHWWRNQRTLPPSPARSALGNMRNIFMFCGICGYLFIPIKMFWPAWRLYDMVMFALVFYTWRYALNARDLQVIYTAIGRSDQLAADLAQSREESKRKSFFLNAISHDLRTPLNGLLLHANLAEISAGNGETAAVAESLAEIKAACRRTADLLDGLLEYARLESAAEGANDALFDLDTLVRDVLTAHAAAAAAKSLTLGDAPNTGLTLRTDRLKLDRILNNLLSNAIKFTTVGAVTIEVARLGNGMEIHVIDTGVGISADHRERLFEEFFQVHNHERDRQKGFGLGLAISNRLVRQLGGELRVDSTPDRGSRFTVALPGVVPSARAQVSSVAGQPAAVQPAAVRGDDPAAGALGGG
jgi:signal transduction histidine kinase